MNNPAYNLLAPLPIIGDKVTDLSAYLSGMFKIGIGLAIAFAILMIVWGGLEYMLSGIPGVKGDGLKKMNDAILGLLLVLGAWLLLYTINPNLVKFDVSIASLNLATSTPEKAYDYQIELNKQTAENRRAADKLDAQAAQEKNLEVKAVLEKEAQAIRDMAITLKNMGDYKITALEAVTGGNTNYSKATTLKIQINIESRNTANKLQSEGFTTEAEKIRTDARQAGLDIDKAIQNRQQFETEKSQSSLDSSFH